MHVVIDTIWLEHLRNFQFFQTHEPTCSITVQSATTALTQMYRCFRFSLLFWDPFSPSHMLPFSFLFPLRWRHFLAILPSLPLLPIGNLLPNHTARTPRSFLIAFLFPLSLSACALAGTPCPTLTSHFSFRSWNLSSNVANAFLFCLQYLPWTAPFNCFVLWYSFELRASSEVEPLPSSFRGVSLFVCQSERNSFVFPTSTTFVLYQVHCILR